MYWGAGPELGLLTLIGYLFFVTGAAMLWRSRADFSFWVFWMYDEVGALRRGLSRYTVAGPFYSPRQESRLKTLPSGFVRSLGRIPRKRIHPGVILLMAGPILLLLDFFI